MIYGYKKKLTIKHLFISSTSYIEKNIYTTGIKLNDDMCLTQQHAFACKGSGNDFTVVIRRMCTDGGRRLFEPQVNLINLHN